MTPQTPPVRIAIVDDHEIVTTGLSLLLEEVDDVEVVGTTTDPARVPELIAATRADVLLTDLSMPRMSGLDLIDLVRREHPGLPIVVLSASTNTAEIAAAIQAGAAGFLLKDASVEQIRTGVLDAARGELVVSPQIGVALARHLREPKETGTLSERELDILRLVSLGETNGQICRKLHISEATVKTYLTRCYTKLDVRDRASAVRVAIARGLLEATPD